MWIRLAPIPIFDIHQHLQGLSSSNAKALEQRVFCVEIVYIRSAQGLAVLLLGGNVTPVFLAGVVVEHHNLVSSRQPCQNLRLKKRKSRLPKEVELLRFSDWHGILDAVVELP